jgi:hypothetical protein
MLQNFSFFNIFLFISFEYMTYFFTYKFLDNYNLNFNKITPSHKKNYVAMNITKFVYLQYLVFIFVYNFFFDNYASYNLLKNIGAIYVLLDIIALFVVKNMQLNTKIHHIVVQFLYLICFYYNFDLVYPIVSGIVVYTFFSSCSGIVNYFIALRVYNVKDEYMIKLSKISYSIYGISCFINWLFQLYFITVMNINMSIIYGLLLLMIINDDIILIKYLIKYSKEIKNN